MGRGGDGEKRINGELMTERDSEDMLSFFTN
jgi:hypothetical protein